jgi:hypothetical protein
MNPDRPEETRKPYHKPALSEVPLRPEEAVLGNCKIQTISGPAMSDCASFTGCASLGS